MTKQKENKFILFYIDDFEPVNALYSENDIVRIANEQRNEYMKDEIDSDYIKECFPEPIVDFNGACDWFKGMGQEVLPFTDKLNATQRILKRLYDNNGAIHGKLEDKEQKGRVGYWNFEIKILDIDEFFNMRMQLKMLKMCPSGISDNGIKIVEHPVMSLLEIEGEMDRFIQIILRRNYGYYYKYKISNWSI